MLFEYFSICLQLINETYWQDDELLLRFEAICVARRAAGVYPVGKPLPTAKMSGMAPKDQEAEFLSTIGKSLEQVGLTAV